MKNKLLFFSIVASLVISNSFAQKIELDALDGFIDQLVLDFEVPGLSISIVKNDSIIYSKGFGTRKITDDLPVDANTIFGIGSISKSFTALTLGILVDEGKINWDDKVKDYLPYFKLYDSYVTNNFTIRDLLTHRSGLKDVSGGTLWYHSDFSRTEIIKRLKHLEPVSGYREKPAYQNVMFVVAGEIVRAVTGTSWDDFLKTQVFDKLGMSNSTSISTVRESNKNLAQPHVWNENFEKTAVEQERGDNLAAAGFVYSSTNDMSSYMRLLLNDGIFKQDTIVSKEVIDEIFRPQIIYPINGPPFGNEFSSYGFGWWLTPIKGHKIIEHSGGIDGMSANLFMVKDLNIGVIILTNTSKEPSTFLLTAKIMEQLFEDESFDIYERVKGFRNKRLEGNKNAVSQKTKIDGTQPSLNLESYSGVYRDEMYGEILINQLKDDAMEISFSHTPIFRGKLKHWHFDTFQIDWHDIRVPDGYVTFNFNSDGEIVGMILDQENLLDVDFGELDIQRLKEDNPIKAIVVDDKILESYVGNYELASDFFITITKTESQLIAQATGQSEILIFPKSNTIFYLNDVEAELRFNINNEGKVESLTLFQGGQQLEGKRME